MVPVKLHVLAGEAREVGEDLAPEAAHVSLDVADVARSIAFYRALLGVEPALVTSDLARFEHRTPALVLSLVRTPARQAGRIDHLGLRLADPEALDRCAARLRDAGIPFDRETEVVCCDATQTKVWAHDPDGVAWEIYLRHDAPAMRPRAATGPEPASRDVRRFALGIHDRWPETISHEDGSLDEALLDGTMNLRDAPARLPELLAALRRALRPGGALRLRGLVASGPLPAGALPLPGPARLVERVPVEPEPAHALAAAGLTDVTIATLRDRADFSLGGASRPLELREVVVVGVRPLEGADTLQPVVYRGPFASVTDDHGRRFERGIRTWIPRARALDIARGPLASSFALAGDAVDEPASSPDGGCCE